MDSGRAVDEDVAKNGRPIFAFPLTGKSRWSLLSVECKIMAVGIDCAACSLNLTPPVAGLKTMKLVELYFSLALTLFQGKLSMTSH